MLKKKIFRLIPCLALVEVVVIVALALFTRLCPGGQFLSPGANSHLLYGWQHGCMQMRRGEWWNCNSSQWRRNSNSRRNSFLL